jgi:hypothetical protein
MRAVGLLAIFLTGVLILALVLFRVPDRVVRMSGFLRGEPARPSIAESSKTTPENSTPTSKGRRKSRSGKETQPDGTGQGNPAAGKAAQLPVAELVVGFPPSPTAQNVSLGTARTSLVSEFGEPDLKATTVSGKRLIERYVYVIGKDRMTVIVLSGAKVVQVATDAASYHAHEFGASPGVRVE